MHTFLLVAPIVASLVQVDPAGAVAQAFDQAWVVAVGENHGHRELHDLMVDILQDSRIVDRVDDIAVEWGNSLYQPVIDRYVSGGEVPWDSVSMAWRNTIVSPNTVWDSPVYGQFFASIRRINSELPTASRYRVLLTDSPVDWALVDSVPDLRAFFDRARSMADVIRRESLGQGRRTLFLAGGLHVHRAPRVRPNSVGVPIGEITPVAWLELHHPGSTYVIQSMGAAQRLDLPRLVGDGPPQVVRLAQSGDLAAIEANRVTTLRNRDGSRPDVYGNSTLGDIVDAVILWDPDDLTFPDIDRASFQDGWYWDELNRRSLMVRGQPMDASIR